MSESINIKLNRRALKKIRNKANQALAQTGLVLQDDMREEQIIPRDTGALQNEKFYVDTTQKDKGKVVLTFEGPYARRLYYHPEYNFSKEKNPNAQGLWMRPWQKGGNHEGRAKEIFEALLKRSL